jgi:hypothetical protein
LTSQISRFLKKDSPPWDLLDLWCSFLALYCSCESGRPIIGTQWANGNLEILMKEMILTDYDSVHILNHGLQKLNISNFCADIMIIGPQVMTFNFLQNSIKLFMWHL